MRPPDPQRVAAWRERIEDLRRDLDLSETLHDLDGGVVQQYMLRIVDLLETVAAWASR